MNAQVRKSKLEQVCNVIATAKWMDLIGVTIVIAVAVSAGYATETLGQVAKWAFSLVIQCRKPPHFNAGI